MSKNDDRLVEIDVRDYTDPWYKVTVWNRDRERSGVASPCRLMHMMMAVAKRYPRAVKSSPRRPWQEGMTMRHQRGGRVVLKVVPLVH
jgi:hypothetical protein